jgi:tetratricopeptide (TPR) repeat protein
LLAVTFFVYAQVRHFDFVTFDDPEYVANPHARAGLTGDGLKWAVTSRDAANWFPVTRLSHELDNQLFGFDAGAHHLVNVAIHGAASVFLFLFLISATRARWPSAFAAAIFALHPLHVESVAWIAERKDVLCAFFWFLGLWLYARYARQPSGRRYAAVLAAFVLGLLSKPMMVTFPLVLLIMDFWPLSTPEFAKRTQFRKLADKAPLFALSGALAVFTFFTQRASGAVESAATFRVGLRIENALVSYGTYIEQMFWPAKLAVFYPFPQHIPLWQPVLCTAVLVAISARAVFTKRTHPYLLAGWSWYLITLIPVIGLVQVGSQAHADRYMYIPMAGLLIMIGWGGAALARGWRQRKAAFAAGGALACIGCAAVTSSQLATWQNSETLYRHAISVTRNNYLAENNLGTFLLRQPGRTREAADHLRLALQINPGSAVTLKDFAHAVAALPPEEAASEYRAVLPFEPNSAEVHYNLGLALAKLQRRAEAERQFREVLRIAPGAADAHNNLGVLLSRDGRKNEAIGEFEAAVREKPGDAEAQYNLGMLLVEAGRTADGLPHLEAAERLRPDPDTEGLIEQIRRKLK